MEQIEQTAHDIIDKMNDAIAQMAADVLNEAFEADPATIHALICNRVPCNDALAEHPEVVVSESMVLQPGHYSVGLMGVLNGILMRAIGRRVAVKWGEVKPDGGRDFLGFVALPPEEKQPTEQ